MASILYTWSIDELSCIPTAGSLTDYVVIAKWTCTGSDGACEGSVTNDTVFNVDPSKKDYVPYDDLQEAEVIEWVQEALGFDTVQLVYSKINTQIQGQEDPTLINPPLPWS